ncbi:MAG: 3'-5' exonuclease [Lachnospiraceae bacterium]|nr:3'-5' exonuclease [Lachnospiraceae bacterium]
MSLLYCDTETTGFSPKDSAPFEIAFIFVSTTKDGQKYEVKKGFRLNPLNDTIKYHEQACLTHGVTEETIRSYPPANAVIPQIKSFLKSCSKGYGLCPEEKPYLTGYCIDFDYRHVKKLLEDYGVSLNNYISPRHLDVLKQVHSAKARGILRGIEDCRQETVAEFLEIENIKSHSAAGDITTTREITKILHEKGVKLY